jgi:hypothetical protein
MRPEARDDGKGFTGGKLYWQATGVRALVPAGHRSRSDG